LLLQMNFGLQPEILLLMARSCRRVALLARS
jgi:hypothetical protein